MMIHSLARSSQRRAAVAYTTLLLLLRATVSGFAHGGLGWMAPKRATLHPSTAWHLRTQHGKSVSSSTTAMWMCTSVVQVSVAVDVPDRDDFYSLLSVLDRLAHPCKYSSREDVRNLISQVAVELLRRKSSIQAASSRYKHVENEKEGQRVLLQWSVDERSKFEQESVTTFSILDVSLSAIGGRGDDASNCKETMAVVTLIVSMQGDSTDVSQIHSLTDVKAALLLIAVNAKMERCLTGAEILWTPLHRNETVSLMDVMADYPELTSV